MNRQEVITVGVSDIQCVSAFRRFVVSLHFLVTDRNEAERDIESPEDLVPLDQV